MNRLAFPDTPKKELSC